MFKELKRIENVLKIEFKFLIQVLKKNQNFKVISATFEIFTMKTYQYSTLAAWSMHAETMVALKLNPIKEKSTFMFIFENKFLSLCCFQNKMHTCNGNVCELIEIWLKFLEWIFFKFYFPTLCKSLNFSLESHKDWKNI